MGVRLLNGMVYRTIAYAWASFRDAHGGLLREVVYETLMVRSAAQRPRERTSVW